MLEVSVHRGVEAPAAADEVWATIVEPLMEMQSLFDRYGYLPAAGDRHLAEFFPYFLTDATRAGADYGVLLTTIEHRYGLRDGRIHSLKELADELKMSREGVRHIETRALRKLRHAVGAGIN